MIASVAFRNFKALRNTEIALSPFNLVIGPNGSGKTSLIEALVRLRDLAELPSVSFEPVRPARAESLEVTFRFTPPHAELEARLACTTDFACDVIQIRTPAADRWNALREDLAKVRSYIFDHSAMAQGDRTAHAELLAPNAGNLASVLARRRELQPADFQNVESEFCRLLPEFSRIDFRPDESDRMRLIAVLGDGSEIPASNLSQGTLYTLALLTLAFDPSPASLICIEEIDRGIHPRMLREIRDALYRLSYPASFGHTRRPVQVIATTHSPYLLDLFRDHPEEVVIAQKQGQEARFERLSDRADLNDLLQEGTLGDMWFAGILGGVPEEAQPVRDSTRSPL